MGVKIQSLPSKEVPSPLVVAMLMRTLSFSGNSWLIQGEPRRRHPLQEVLEMRGSNLHFIFRRLHSQQLWVPLRTFLRLAGP